MHLTFRQIRYFVAIVDAGTMSRAADHLGVAPTALSLQVRLMEERLGVSLLQRHSRGVLPTSSGRELYERGRHILAMVKETERRVAPPAAKTPRRLRLGMPPNVLRLIGVETVLAGMRQLDGVLIEIVEGFSSDLPQRLQAGELDFGLGFELRPLPSIKTAGLIEEDLIFATAPQHARAGGAVTLAEAVAAELVLYGEQDVCWQVIHQAAHSEGLRVNVAHKVASLDVIRHMVGRGMGNAILPFGLVEEEIRRGDIALHTITDRTIRMQMSLAWMQERIPAHEVEELTGFIKDVILDLHARTAPHSRLLLARGGEFSDAALC